MAKRMPIVIDAEPVYVESATPLSQMVSTDVKSVTTNSGKIIPRELFNSTRANDVAEGFDTQTATVNMGAYGLSQRDRLRYLQHEAAMLENWLAGFEPCNAGPRGTTLGPDGQVMLVGNFPLPDQFQPDHIHLAIYTEFYPERAPVGIYLIDKPENRSAIARIRSVLNVFDAAAYHGAEPPIPGFAWVCMYKSFWPISLRT
jgi:hypothetical protein